MDWTGDGGGRILAGKLKELEDALDEYYGAIAMQREGLTVQIPDKPEALKLLEQCEVFGIPLVAGGLMSQPHIWLLEVGVIRRHRQIREMLESMEASGGDNAAIQ